MYYISQLNSYLLNTRFAPFCIGFFRMSGTIGKRRAKRAIHLFQKANTNDAHDFLIYVLSKLGSAERLKLFLNKYNARLNVNVPVNTS